MNAGVISPVETDADVGFTLTDNIGDVTVMVTGPLLTVTPPSVAFTKREAIPAVYPAVNATASPLDALS